MEKQETKQEEMETNLKEQGFKYDKLASDIEMHNNIILAFAHDSQSDAGHPIVSTGSVRDRAVDEEIMQKTAMALTKQPDLQADHGPYQVDLFMEEAPSALKFS